jgi:hypothetical protein
MSPLCGNPFVHLNFFSILKNPPEAQTSGSTRLPAADSEPASNGHVAYDNWEET